MNYTAVEEDERGGKEDIRWIERESDRLKTSEEEKKEERERGGEEGRRGRTRERKQRPYDDEWKKGKKK